MLLPLGSGGTNTNQKKQIYKLNLFLNNNKRKILAAITLLFVLFWIIPSSSHEEINYNTSSSLVSKVFSSIAGVKSTSPKIMIILAVNSGGGVLRWKSEQEWAIERLSISNKRNFCLRHGYGLAIKDMTTDKRYSHEYREGWHKADVLKQTMREFPDTEWFWWLDTETLIMEPHISIEDHILNRLDSIAERTIQHFNPLALPINIANIDYKERPDLLLTQDCTGFNLGSFMIRNTEWSSLLLDMWWDPAAYVQKHMVWEHREQDALESMYANQPWVRSKIAFIPLRSINSLPPGACSDQANDDKYLYSSKENDFVINMDGCSYGRDCWGEMQKYMNIYEIKNNKWYNKLFGI
ncbi:hypothetical protein QEN19_002037 [Hanseniaspora menglaensis]